MATLPRRSIPATNNPVFKPVPFINAAQEPKSDSETTDVSTSIFVPLTKATKDEQTVTGVVLQPDVVDAHGDIVKASVIRKAAHNFLDSYNMVTKLGLQHKDFKKQFQLLESYVAPQDIVLGGNTVKEGSWVIVVKILDSKIWEKVKKGEITGFSIGGKARAKKLAA